MSISLGLNSLLSHALQFHKVSACLTGYRQAAHDYNMLAVLDELIVLQALVNSADQVFGATMHVNVIGPDAPPEGELTVNMFRWGVGQNRDARTVF